MENIYFKGKLLRILSNGDKYFCSLLLSSDFIKLCVDRLAVIKWRSINFTGQLNDFDQIVLLLDEHFRLLGK